jgi:hypothetical protein
MSLTDSHILLLTVLNEGLARARMRFGSFSDLFDLLQKYLTSLTYEHKWQSLSEHFFWLVQAYASTAHISPHQLAFQIDVCLDSNCDVSPLCSECSWRSETVGFPQAT